MTSGLTSASTRIPSEEIHEEEEEDLNNNNEEDMENVGNVSISRLDHDPFSDPEALHVNIINRIGDVKKDMGEAFMVIKALHAEALAAEKKQSDEDNKLDKEIAEVEEQIRSQDEENRVLEEEIEKKREEMANSKKQSNPEIQELEAEYTAQKGSFGKLKEMYRQMQEWDSDSENFRLNYGINLAVVEDDPSMKALVFNKIDPSDPDRQFYIYFNQWTQTHYNVSEVYPETEEFDKLAAAANKSQNLVDIIIPLRELWIKKCVNESTCPIPPPSRRKSITVPTKDPSTGIVNQTIVVPHPNTPSKDPTQGSSTKVPLTPSGTPSSNH